jgi:hypothetical protein
VEGMCTVLRKRFLGPSQGKSGLVDSTRPQGDE